MNDFSGKILIVDDIPQNIQIVGEILKSNGYYIAFAQSGKTALSLIEQNHFDLILLDVMMPEMSGYEVIQRIKSKEKTKSIPVIFLTARSEAEDTIHGFRLGAVDYITKPFNSAELLARVKTHIELEKTKKEILKKNTQLENTNKIITDSLNYAKRIQYAVFPHPEDFSAIMPEHFVYFKPRDVVSGDFYWVKKIKHKVLIVLGDCTGHGVPGALMSMLGISILNEISANLLDLSTKFIYNKLNEKLENIFRQHSNPDGVNDGIEIVICLLDYNTNTLQFTGSNSLIYLVTKNKGEEFNLKQTYSWLSENDKTLIYRKKNTWQINHRLPKDISEKTIQLLHGDIVYLTSDGYADQIGGEKNRKYLKPKFLRKLLQISQKSMKEQYEILKTEMEEWIGDKPQVDDILVIGFKLTEKEPVGL